jgi:tetratricopeptide (TPR) repeat protein
MSPRARVYAVVAAAALVAAAAVVGVAYLQARGQSTTRAGAVTKPHAGLPPLFFDFGTRSDAESSALARGAALLHDGKRAQAAAIFDRYDSVQAQIGRAFAAWPSGSLDEMKHLLALHEDDPVVNLHYAIALYWSGRNADAVKQFQAVDTKFPDSASSVDAEDILYADRFVPGLPHMIAPVAIPSGRTIGEQLAKATSPLQRGVIDWYLDRRVSARRALTEAARAAPADPMVQTLAAVSYYSKRNPTAAFSRLGPLSGRFPKAAVVYLHLGELLLWQKELQKARTQLEKAVAVEPRSVYAAQAKKLLSALATNGTK